MAQLSGDLAFLLLEAGFLELARVRATGLAVAQEFVDQVPIDVSPLLILPASFNVRPAFSPFFLWLFLGRFRAGDQVLLVREELRGLFLLVFIARGAILSLISDGGLSTAVRLRVDVLGVLVLGHGLEVATPFLPLPCHRLVLLCQDVLAH